MMKKIFISYRREETRHSAHRIYAHLASKFGKNSVFFDVHAVGLGDFRRHIDAAIDQSAIVVAVIGCKWLHYLREREQQRKHDWVRDEIKRAYEQKITVFPIRVDGAAVFDERELPDDLKGLTFDQSLEVHDDPYFDSDLEIISEKIRQGLGPDPDGDGGGPHGPDPSRFWDQREGRRRGFIALLIMLGVWGGLFVHTELWPVKEIDHAALGELLYANCWVHYDPSQKKLDPQRHPIYPSADSIQRDLKLIKVAGFSGVITSSSDGIMVEVPRLASNLGLRVIMGVWNPADHGEVSRAIGQAKYVDAYCVGDNGLLGRYSLEDLKRAVSRIKRRTGRPATVTEPAKTYSASLAELGDWLFPDAHITLHSAPGLMEFNADIERDIELFMRSTEALAALAKAAARPLVFKNVAYPYAGVRDGSRSLQADFFDRLLERLNDPQYGHGVKIAVIPLGAFDAPWKRYAPFFPWDPYTGLIVRGTETEGESTNASPSRADILTPAARAIIRRYPNLDPELRGLSVP